MIARLTGTASRITHNPLVLDVHGVGYAVFVPQKLLSMARTDAPLTVYTHTHVREDALQLFGFASEDELNLFEQLLTVSGIGPKTALAVLDRGGATIRKAIAAADVDFFMTVPRLGKKNAQKIIIELKNKLGSPTDLDLTRDADGETKQIMDALLSMGFDQKEVKGVIAKLPEGTIESKVRHALKTLAKR